MGDSSGHPGGHQCPDERSDRQRCAGDQKCHCKRLALHEGGHARCDGREAGATHDDTEDLIGLICLVASKR